MGKKGKKKGGKGKKSGGGGKKGAGREDEMTLKEAILAFQIQIKEKDAEELRHETKGLQDKNSRHHARNVRLKEEQQIHIKTLLKQAKEQEKELEQKEVFNKEHVEKTMMGKWDLEKTEEQSIVALKQEIDSISEELDAMNKEVERWREYKKIGFDKHKTQVQLLDLELEDMQQNFSDMTSHLQRQLDVAKSEVIAHMNTCMAEQKHLASEKAMSHLDKDGVQEVVENEWLKKEAKTHREEEKSLRKQVQELEEQNLAVISELLDCRVEDLKISKNFAQDGTVADANDLSYMDRNQISIYQPNYESPSVTPLKELEYRPRSAMLEAIENRVFSYSPVEDTDNSMLEWDENILEQQEFLHLGPLELKLLCVNGSNMPVNKLEQGQEVVNITSTSDDTKVIRTKWPVTPLQIKSVVNSTSESLGVI